MKKLAFLLIAASLAGIVSAQSDKAISLYVGDKAPPLKIAKWEKGTPIANLGHGKIKVVEFWATWCGPCKVSIPHLTELAKKYDGKVDFIGVDSFERIPDAAACYKKVDDFVQGMGDKMDYHVAIDGVDGTMGKTWMDAAGQMGIPCAFVIDGQGKVAWIGHPMMGLDETLGQILDGSYDMKKAAADEKVQIAKQQDEMKASKAINEAMGNFLKEAKAGDPNAMTDAQKIADGVGKDNPEILNELAWEMVEDNSPVKSPDYNLAIKFAEQAVKLSNEDPSIEDTLALAYFRADRYQDAASLEDKAVAKAGSVQGFDAATLTEMKKRLDMYQAKLKASTGG